MVMWFVSAQAQTYTRNAVLAIPDNGPIVSDSLSVNLLPSNTLDTLFGLESVCVNLTHPYVGDLYISLMAPDGTVIELSTGNGGSGDDYINTCFNATATLRINQGAAPYTGSFRPEGILGNVNNGQDGNGIWQLLVQDRAGQDTGTVNSWSLTFGNRPARNNLFRNSNLPIIAINTYGRTIVDEPKARAMMRIIDNPSGRRNAISDSAAYYGAIGIEIRGSSSAGFPQLPYGFETWDALDNDLDTSLLGMPKESDWILYAPYNDKSLMRNVMAYQLSNEMGRYASRTRFCELVLNGEYRGIYVLMEKIKRDRDRVDIDKLNPTDVSGNNLTGGYIIKVDKTTGASSDGWYSQFNPCLDPMMTDIPYLQYHYPNPGDIVPAQKTYIQQYMFNFESSLASPNFQDTVLGWRRFAGENTFIDHSLLVELGKNVDGYRISSFLHKNRLSKGGKLKAGPIWDYNLAFGNADYYDGAVPSDWQWVCTNGDGLRNPFWWERLTTDSLYFKRMKCRYTSLRSTLWTEQRINAKIDSIVALCSEAQVRHFERWPILGRYVWPNAYVPATFQQEVDTLKGWFRSRWRWMDTQLLSSDCQTISGVEELDDLGGYIKAYPNPASIGQRIELLFDFGDSHTAEQLSVTDMLGRMVHFEQLSLGNGPHSISLNTNDWASGVYFVKVRLSNQQLVTQKVLVHD